MATLKISFAAAALALMVFAAAFYWLGWIRFSYPDPQRFPIRGIDVSYHQGAIDWMRVKGQGIRFAYLEASDGGDWRDPLYAKNTHAAHAAGLRVGAYHHFNLCEPAGRQAQNFLAAAPAEDLSLPPAIDLRYIGNCDRRPTRSEFAYQLQTYLRVLAGHIKVAPVLFVSRSFYRDYLSNTPFAAGPLWVREIMGLPHWADKAKVEFHQFAVNMRLKGISGPVNMEVFLGTPADFARLRPSN